MANLRRKQLLRERSALINEWVSAREEEKAEILLKIMDIDTQLESNPEEDGERENKAI